MDEEIIDDNLVIEENETPAEDNSPDSQDNQEKSHAELRHSQQMEWSRKEVERLKKIALDTAVNAAKVDANTLLDLHKQDPKLANEASKAFNWKDTQWWSYENFLSWREKWNTVLQEDDREIRYQKKRAQEKHEEALQVALEMLSGLPQDKQQEAISKFDEMTEWKMLTEKKAKEFVEMVTLYVNKDKIKTDKRVSTLADLASTNVTVTSTPSGNTAKQGYYINEMWEVVLDTNSSK